MLKISHKLHKIKGDASFREFYRKKIKSKSSIIIFSKKEKRKNLLIYDAINKILIMNKFIAPKLIYQEYKNNFIEVKDLGKETALDVIKRKKSKFSTFEKIIDLLIKMQGIKTKKIKNFQNQLYKIPTYSNKMLFNEAKLFCDWYVPENVRKNKSKINKILVTKIKNLLQKLKLKNDTFVHRDFHVSNLMYFKNKLAFIDTQDAVIGNQAYDVLRNLKIIGIFTRLAKRDNKKLYLKLIPYTWRLIDLRCQNNELLKDLIIFLHKYFPKKIRNKYGN